MMNDVIQLSAAPRDTGKLSDRVVLDLQQKILTGELQGGSRLPTEVELCGIFQVSRTVIRDALRTLSAMGLIAVEHGYGTRVTHPNDRSAGVAMAILLLRSGLSIGDVLDARSIIEPELCALAARYATDDDVNRLAQHLDAFRTAVWADDTKQAFEEHLGFHSALYDAIRVPAASLLLRPMIEVILLTSFPPQLNDSKLWEVEGHEKILEALRERDEEKLKRCIRAHFHEMQTPEYVQYRKTALSASPAVSDLMSRINEACNPSEKSAAVSEM